MDKDFGYKELSEKIERMVFLLKKLLKENSKVSCEDDEIKEGDIVRFKGGVDEYKVKSVDDSLGTFDISPNFFPNEGVYWDGVNKRYFEKVK